MKRTLTIITLFFFFQNTFLFSQLYFPPNSGGQWDTIHPSRFGWCDENINELYSFIENANSDAFLLLKDGKIVLEKYFGSFTKDSLHAWNSAGKTLTAYLIGIAQEKGLLTIDEPSSTYLGQGWTSLTPEQENAIAIKHQLTMTTGLDDSGNFDCTDPNCLTYLSDPGERWAYHNAPYTLLTNVIEEASGLTINNFVANHVNSKIGSLGGYFNSGYNRVYVSTPRNMARFGLLLLANGEWNGTTILSDQTYQSDMLNTSQDLNLAYGYLTWLNGKNSFMLPQTQIVFQGIAMPSAPNDLYAAFGKNSQILNVVPSQNWILVRMGDGDGISQVSTQLNDSIWRRINALQCNVDLEEKIQNQFTICPNPSNGKLKIEGLKGDFNLSISSIIGQNIDFTLMDNEVTLKEKGVFILTLHTDNQTVTRKIIVD